MQLALPKLEQHRVASELTEVQITLPAACKINENAAGDWGYQLRNTQEGYLLTERGHFSASNLQLPDRQCCCQGHVGRNGSTRGGSTKSALKLFEHRMKAFTCQHNSC